MFLRHESAVPGESDMSESRDFEFVTGDELAARLDGDDAPVLIDTHNRDRYAAVHLPGARNALDPGVCSATQHAG